MNSIDIFLFLCFTEFKHAVCSVLAEKIVVKGGSLVCWKLAFQLQKKLRANNKLNISPSVLKETISRFKNLMESKPLHGIVLN